MAAVAGEAVGRGEQARGVPARWERWLSLAALPLAALLLVGSAWPALSTYLFGENFIFLGQYQANGSNFWRGLLSAHDGIWFRPGSFAAELPWNLYLPPVPLLYHLRNLAFVLLALFLLHRLLLHLVASAPARVVALLFFAGSKAHLTLIGYVNLLGSVIILITLLGTLLLLRRYCERRRPLDYALAVLCCWYCIGTKDSAFVVVAIVAAFVLLFDEGVAAGWPRLRYWLPRLVPFGLGSLVYLVARSRIAASAADNPIYAPRLSLDQAAIKLLSFSAAWGNLTFDFRENVRGSLGDGLADVLRATLLPTLAGITGQWLEFALYLALWALVAATVARGWAGEGVKLLFPVVWMGAFLGPSLATRAVHIYYFYEPLAGAAILLGLALARARWRLLGAWCAAVAAIIWLGWASNRTSAYTWRFAADQVARLRQPVIEQYRDQPPASLLLVTDGNSAFWQYALQQPFLPTMLGRPNLRVAIVDPTSPLLAAPAAPGQVVLDLDRGGVAWDPATRGTTPALAALRLVRLAPGETRAGRGFNLQSNGESGLAITCEGARPTTVVIFDGTPLSTAYGSQRLLTVTLPPDRYARPGRYVVYLKDGDRESNRVEFVVSP
ncbi:MAG: hypothetical protein U0232_04170 [Thermomicrobiales bacterium]